MNSMELEKKLRQQYLSTPNIKEKEKTNSFQNGVNVLHYALTEVVLQLHHNMYAMPSLRISSVPP